MVPLGSRPPGLVKRRDPYPGPGWQESGPGEPVPTDRGSGRVVSPRPPRVAVLAARIHNTITAPNSRARPSGGNACSARYELGHGSWGEGRCRTSAFRMSGSISQLVTRPPHFGQTYLSYAFDRAFGRREPGSSGPG